MPTLLESLYYGHLLPAEQMIPKSPEYRQLNRALSAAMENLQEKLSGQEFDELESMMDIQQKMQGMEMAAAFIHGFKLGAGLMGEVYADSNNRTSLPHPSGSEFSMKKSDGQEERAGSCGNRWA